MLPFYLLSKTGIYDVQMDGVNVKTRVADQADVVATGINELKTAEFLKMRPPVVALDVKVKSGFACLLILRTKSHCLIVLLKYLNSAPESLIGFLNDQNICFVGVSMRSKIDCIVERLRNLINWQSVACKTGIDVGDLAARILKKPNLSGSGLLDIAREIGILDAVKPALQVASGSGSGSVSVSSSLNWSAQFFSPEEVKNAIQEASAAYKVGTKLLSMI